MVIALRFLFNSFWVMKSPQILWYFPFKNIKWWQQSDDAVHTALVWNTTCTCTQHYSFTDDIKFVKVKPFSNGKNILLHKHGREHQQPKQCSLKLKWCVVFRESWLIDWSCRLIYKSEMSLNRVLTLSKVWPLPIPIKACSKKDNMPLLSLYTMLNI